MAGLPMLSSAPTWIRGGIHVQTLSGRSQHRRDAVTADKSFSNWPARHGRYVHHTGLHRPEGGDHTGKTLRSARAPDGMEHPGLGGESEWRRPTALTRD